MEKLFFERQFVYVPIDYSRSHLFLIYITNKCYQIRQNLFV